MFPSQPAKVARRSPTSKSARNAGCILVAATGGVRCDAFPSRGQHMRSKEAFAQSPPEHSARGGPCEFARELSRGVIASFSKFSSVPFYDGTLSEVPVDTIPGGVFRASHPHIDNRAMAALRSSQILFCKTLVYSAVNSVRNAGAGRGRRSGTLPASLGTAARDP